MPTLSDRLKSLGVKIGAQDLPPPASKNYSIEHVAPGRVCATEYGDTFVVETLYPLDYQHGTAGLPLSVSLQTISAWARDERLAQCAASALLFLDTETTGLAGGTGTYAFLIGIGRLAPDDGGFRLTQFFMRDPREEPAVLAALARALEPDDSLVTFNGKAFDIPLLNTRFIGNGRATPFSPLPHLDLLPLARRLWRDRLESRALGSLETHILGARRTEQDIPGWLIPQIYFDYLRTGDARPLKRVLYHNAMDVLAMAALLSHMAAMLADPLTFAVEHGLDLIAIAKLFEELDRLEEAVRLYRRGLECDLPEQTWRQTVQRLALVHRRRGEMSTAVELWREAAGTRQIYAFVELAKYYEHGMRDYREAERWTQDALALVTARDASPVTRAEWQAGLEHRLARLQGRLKKQGG